MQGLCKGDPFPNKNRCRGQLAGKLACGALWRDRACCGAHGRQTSIVKKQTLFGQSLLSLSSPRLIRSDSVESTMRLADLTFSLSVAWNYLDIIERCKDSLSQTLGKQVRDVLRDRDLSQFDEARVGLKSTKERRMVARSGNEWRVQP